MTRTSPTLSSRISPVGQVNHLDPDTSGVVLAADSLWNEFISTLSLDIMEGTGLTTLGAGPGQCQRSQGASWPEHRHSAWPEMVPPLQAGIWKDEQVSTSLILEVPRSSWWRSQQSYDLRYRCSWHGQRSRRRQVQRRRLWRRKRWRWQRRIAWWMLLKSCVEYLRRCMCFVDGWCWSWWETKAVEGNTQGIYPFLMLLKRPEASPLLFHFFSTISKNGFHCFNLHV